MVHVGDPGPAFGSSPDNESNASSGTGAFSNAALGVMQTGGRYLLAGICGARRVLIVLVVLVLSTLVPAAIVGLVGPIR